MIARIAIVSAFAFILAMLVSCAATTSIPDTLLQCKAEPKYQGRTEVSAADVIEFADQLAVAGADCRAKVKAIRKIVKS